MRYLLLLAMSLLLSCAVGKLDTATHDHSATHAQPVVVGTDTMATVTTIHAGKKSTVVVQLGTGNQASAPKTDNTGRAASQGANGGHATHEAGTPWGVYGLLVMGSMVGGWVLRGKASTWSWWPRALRPT